MKMLPLLVLAALAGCSSAQFVSTICECGLFNDGQFNKTLTPNPIPLDYAVSEGGVPDTNCNRDPALSNECMIFCQSFYDGSGSLDLCDSTGNNARCIGSQWCETLYNNGVRNIANGVVSLYYRMPQCEGTAFTEWTYGWREIKDQGLCCTNGEYNNCVFPCETCVEKNLCECGIFAEQQFDIEILDGANPLPLQNVGAEFGPPSDFYCSGWPSPEFGHPCDNACVLSFDFYKSNVSLASPSNRNPDVSYGQFYCQALKTRWADNWPEFGVGPTSLVAYARMPGCNIDETGAYLRWQRNRAYGCHHEQLCCDGDGNRYPCPVISPL